MATTKTPARKTESTASRTSAAVLEEPSAARRTTLAKSVTPSATRSVKAATTKATTSKAAPTVAPSIKTPSRTRASAKVPAAGSSAALESALQEPVHVSPELRHHMIRDAAYYRAERRDFREGDPAQDWLEAEAEIDRMLGMPSEATHHQG